jgi:Family of unknown function (DUF5947)
MTSGALSSLRAFARPRVRIERCELCAAPIAAEHEHLVDPGVARIRCACAPCALLFSLSAEGLRRIDSFATRLEEPTLDDATWSALGVPVGLAFFCRNPGASGVTARLPGRAGVVEREVPADVWDELARRRPELATLRPEVDALLVRRTGKLRDYFITSIDHCYRLAGLLRSAGAPLSGPDPEVVDAFFSELARPGAEPRPHGSRP